MPKTKPASEALRDAIAAAERAGITKYRISRDTGLNEAHIGRIAAGKAMPGLDTAQRILAAIGGELKITPPRKPKR